MQSFRGRFLSNSKFIWAYTTAFILVLPNFIWIVLDESVWRGDPVGYALGSVALYQKMITNAELWMRYLFGGYKGPLILWLGQFFVAFGNFIGSINFALLLIPLIATFITFLLLFRTFELTFKNKAIALCGCLTVAASPLLNSVSTGFWIEPMQLAITCWFIYAMVRASSWSFYFTLSQFIIAGSLAMLIKLSSPIYIIGPAIAFWITVFRGSPSMSINRKDIIFLIIALLFFVPAAVFYLHNLTAMLDFARFAATSPLFAATISKYDLWIEYLSNGIFLTLTFGLVLVLLLLGIVKTIKQGSYRSFAPVCMVALFQIAIFFLAWVSSANGDPRYFLPTVPYFSILICWSLAAINNRLLTVLSVGLFLLQFGAVNGFTFGLTELAPSYVHLCPLIREPNRNMRLIHDLMPLATRDSSLVFDLNPELGIAEFQYELAKQNLYGNWLYSSIDISGFFNINHQEIDTGKINVETVWKNMLVCRPDFYVTWNSRLSSSLIETEMQRIDMYNAATVPLRWAIAEKIKNCSLYEIVPFATYPELLVYKRKDLPFKVLLKTPSI